MHTMIVLRAAFVGIALLCSVSQAQVRTYDPVETRATLLGYLKDPPVTPHEIGGEPANAKARAFLAFFRDQVAPSFEHDQKLSYRYWGALLLRDTGSHQSKEEFDAWTKDLLEILAEDARLTVDPKWTATLVEWARLAEGLNGQLPDFARRAAHKRQIESFDPDMQPLLDRVNQLTTEYEDVLRDVPAVKGKPEADKGKLENRIAFKQGRISFAQAQAAQRALDRRVGDAFVGFEAAEIAGAKLNEIAVLRTRLAQSKGFRTWAEYRLDATSDGYTPEYAGLKNQRQWLMNYLTALRPVAQSYLRSRMKELGLEGQAGDIYLQDLLTIAAPANEMLQPYFPNERITGMWTSTLEASGFLPETLRQIVVDDEFRDGKNRNGAYQASVDHPRNATTRIDAATLDVLPMVRTQPEQIDGLAYILQSYTGRGVEDLRTAFHEGGHATERILKYKEDPAPEGYGYVEVPSLMSEYFLHDPDLLHRLAVPVDGHKPSREEIATFASNARKNAVIITLMGLRQSLFDIDLWNIDYTAGGAPTFLEAIKRVDEEAEALVGLAPAYGDRVPYYWTLISTPHFYSGAVRNIGYDYAHVGAHMMAGFISDELEKKTGRRNWFEQPDFAKIYAEKFVSQGWRQPFPANIESITGRKFDYQNAVNDFARQIEGCGAGLDIPPKK